MQTSLMVFVMLAVFYLIVLRPQQKEMQRREQFRDSLKVGDMVVTSGGIYGKIVDFQQERVVLEVAARTNIRVQKAHIESRQSDKEGAPSASTETSSDKKST